MSTIIYDLGNNVLKEEVYDGFEHNITIDQYPASMSLWRLVKRELLNRRPGGGGKERVRQAIIRELVNCSTRDIPGLKALDSWDKHTECLTWHSTFRNDHVVLMKDNVVIFESKGV
jgi:hypothetical protein